MFGLGARVRVRDSELILSVEGGGRANCYIVGYALGAKRIFRCSDMIVAEQEGSGWDTTRMFLSNLLRMYV